MARSTAPDDFDLALIGSAEFKLPFLGYDSTLDPTNKAVNLLDRGSQNVYRTPAGTIANRPGRLLYDSIDSTVAGVNAAYVWNNSKGRTIPVRIANSKYQFLSDISGTNVWYDLLTGLTLTRGVWDTYWDTTALKDKLLMVFGNNNIYNWEGGIAKFVSATATVITLDRDATAAGFATSGSVTINGTDYTYTGISGSTLTGASDASANALDSVVFSKLVTSANTPTSSATFTNDFIKVKDNQLATGCYNSQTVYISKNTDYTSIAQSTPRVPGEGATLTLDGTVNGIAVRDGKFYISTGTSDWFVVSFKQDVIGTTLTELPEIAKQQSSLGAAAYAHEFIDVMNDTIVYLSKDQQLRAFGSFKNLTQPAYPVLSQEVSTELKGVDFTLGQLKCVADKDRGISTYIVSPNTGTVYLHQTILSVNLDGDIMADRFWQPPFVWGLSRIDAIGTTVYGFSNSNPQMYQLWDTSQWHDDAPGGDTSYTSILVMPYRSMGRRQGKLRFDKTYWEGYMTQGTNLYGAVYLDYQGATATLNPIIHSITESSAANDQSFFTGVVPPSLGDASLGANPLGDITQIVGLGNTALTDHDLLSKFRIIVGVAPTDCYEYALMCYSLDADARWEIIALGANPALSSYEGVELVKVTS